MMKGWSNLKMKNNSLPSDDELIANLPKKKQEPSLSFLKDLNKEDKITGYMRRNLIEAIEDPETVDVVKLRHVHGVMFNAPGESLEMQQLHLFESENKSRFKDQDRKIQILKYMVIGLGVASGLLEVVSWEVVSIFIRGFGF